MRDRAEGIRLKLQAKGRVSGPWRATGGLLIFFAYGFLPSAPGAGAFLGRQASGLPSGAQQLPDSAPRGVVKLQFWPALSALQAVNASAGGIPGRS